MAVEAANLGPLSPHSHVLSSNPGGALGPSVTRAGKRGPRKARDRVADATLFLEGPLSRVGVWTELVFPENMK